MEIKCREPIETAINHHRALSEKLLKETTELVSNPIHVSRLLKNLSSEKAAEALQKQVNDMVSQQNAADKLLNAKVRNAIESAKKAALPEPVKNFREPADYQQQISNALAFLSLEGDGLSDMTAYPILKPFFNDWNQMHLFERVILKQMHLENEYNTRQVFPMALGGVLDAADTYTALFGEAEALLETLFVSKKQHNATCMIGEYAVFGGYGVDSYAEQCAQDRILELATHIDTLCSDQAFVYDHADLKYGRIHAARHQINLAGSDDDDGFVWL